MGWQRARLAEEEHVWEAFLGLQGSLVEIPALGHPLPEPGRKVRLRAGQRVGEGGPANLTSTPFRCGERRGY